ncbi:Osmotically activated L-carnitine/choline ABC transporter, substrate-binding protein OpuCC [Alkalibacterium sp. AK22]|uniref:osmoprotectant ABC transporter substrate-binding protein n=1 Tax=Alkalibacterium sp. AK22 TaxID=1229520 RepID=UPI00045243F4|nr:osmoprotectant ABC transporter substrate-binding protein [Alkalibacterium sp. AK22]EXJ24247.1 Osmotically activated L-carnitine/choline ABC transporter, substrate-binding protein OpuCC [Alkalibacterium sp. AK22]
MKWTKKIKLAALSSTAVFTTACSLPGLGAGLTEDVNIRIATQSSTEMAILGYVIQGMVNHYSEVNAEVIQNLGSSTMVAQALIQGDAEVAAASYTGTALTGELGMDPITDAEEARRVVTEGFEEQFGIKYFPSYGFENTYSFLITTDLAEEHGIESISDLEPIAADLTAGVDTSWMEREGDGYRAFLETYNFEFDTVYPMQVGLVYDAVRSGNMDVVLGYSTDGRIASYDLVLLEDDLSFFPPYDASPSVLFDTLEEFPELEDILLKLEGTIDTGLMQEMNFIADEYLIEPATVAQQFLEANNFFEDAEPYLEPVGGE